MATDDPPGIFGYVVPNSPHGYASPGIYIVRLILLDTITGSSSISTATATAESFLVVALTPPHISSTDNASPYSVSVGEPLSSVAVLDAGTDAPAAERLRHHHRLGRRDRTDRRDANPDRPGPTPRLTP